MSQREPALAPFNQRFTAHLITQLMMRMGSSAQCNSTAVSSSTIEYCLGLVFKPRELAPIINGRFKYINSPSLSRHSILVEQDW